MKSVKKQNKTKQKKRNDTIKKIKAIKNCVNELTNKKGKCKIKTMLKSYS